MQNVEPVINCNVNLYGSDQIHQDKQEEKIYGGKKRDMWKWNFKKNDHWVALENNLL
jgi:hypothetical protein